MGSHSKPRTTGRKTALGALAVGATLTGVGLTAAALDPATAVLSADAAGNGSAIQLSGLADPVAVGPQAATTTLRVLTAAPSTEAVGSVTKTAAKAAGTTLRTAASAARSTPAVIVPAASTTGSSPAAVHPLSAVSSPGRTAIRPIRQDSGALTSGYVGRHRQTRSAPPAPSALTNPGPAASSDLLDSNLPASLLGSTPLADLLDALPLAAGL